MRVVHNTVGDWQFLTGDQMPEDIRLAALEQMVIRDRTLNEAFDLDLDIQWIETLLVENGLKQIGRGRR